MDTNEAKQAEANAADAKLLEEEQTPAEQQRRATNKQRMEESDKLAHPNAVRWHYCAVNFRYDRLDVLMSGLNQLGEKGWELVAINNVAIGMGSAILKRPLRQKKGGLVT